MSEPDFNEQPRQRDGNSITSVSSGYEFQPGQMVAERYEVISRLGKGGMGFVYRVRQILLNKEFALKTMDRRGVSEIAIQRFQQEARTSFALDHPNIITVKDFGLWEDQTPYLVMELLNGETVGERVKRAGCLTVEQAIPIFVQVCFGLAYAHECGIVHRDIKPNNIMILKGLPVGTEGSVKILDFGIAKFTGHEGGEIQALTRTGEIFGSPLYMSPEQCSGWKVDHRADVYALGCVLFEALTGNPPFIGENALSTMMKHQSEKAPSLKEGSLGGEFPQAIEHIVARMLAKSPDDRYQNLGLVAHDLGALKRGASISSAAKITGERANASTKTITVSKSTFYAAIVLVLLLVASAGLAGYMLHDFQSRKEIKTSDNSEAPGSSSGTPKADPNANTSLLNIGNPLDTMTPPIEESELRTALKDQSKQGSKLLIHSNQITEKELALIGTAKWIRTLDLQNCDIKNEGLQQLAELPHLEIVNLNGSTINKMGVEALSHCRQLKELTANQTRLTDKEMSLFANMKGLSRLSIGGTRITDVGLQDLAKSKSIDNLGLKAVKGISNAGLEALERTNLKQINLDDTHIDDSGIPHLTKIAKLANVFLDKTRVTLGGVELLVNGCKNCRTVSLLACPNIGPREFAHLRNEFPTVFFVDKARKDSLQ